MEKRRIGTPENDGFLLLSAFIGVAVIVWFFLAELIYWSCLLLYHLWRLCDLPRIHAFVAQRMNLLAATANSADNVTLMQWLSVMNQTAGILLLFLLPLVIMGVYATFTHPANKTRRKINIHTLPKIMARFSPSIIPALCYGDHRTQLLNVNPPEHRSASDPGEFAQQHQLVVNRHLDHEKATAVFTHQLGRKITQLEDLNAYERALFAVFGLQFFLNDRKTAETLLDTLNRSCLIKSRREKGNIGYPVWSAAHNAFKKVAAHPAARNWIKQHRYARTAISALHADDLHLPTARLRWLKGLDRALWYALCSSDRPKPFVEGAGIVTQAQWEREAAQHHVTLPAPIVLYAVEGLEQDLISMGIVIDDRAPKTDCNGDEEEDLPVPRDHPPPKVEAMPDRVPRSQKVTETEETLPAASFSCKQPKNTF
ncbi:conjugal transfer protein TrbA [Candidatus Fukatsuia symbiotica]|uniref:secretion/conjugation apparatus DotM-related subunit n=1 Tax=Candidatus Fukatsuia symbiotica TaxID=1878942 RepID=UPI001F0828CF|nr:conjugal transfer protein TrbA [Candidatus Fukatsuia symbiotica]MEA9446092.1 conjugal transfer protein TrbA [Candidatus Fukatsuia symbiotica]